MRPQHHGAPCKGEKRWIPERIKKTSEGGICRVRIDGEVRDLAEEMILEKNKTPRIDLVVDRLYWKKAWERDYVIPLEIAASRAEGLVRVVPVHGKEMLFSEKYACPDCGISLPALTPACFLLIVLWRLSRLQRSGHLYAFTEYLVVRMPGLSWEKGQSRPGQADILSYHSILDALATHYGFDINTPFNKLPEKIRKVFFTDQARTTLNFIMIVRIRDTFLTSLLKEPIKQFGAPLERNDDFDSGAQWLIRYIDSSACDTCHGARLKEEVLAVTVNGKYSWTLPDVHPWMLSFFSNNWPCRRRK